MVTVTDASDDDVEALIEAVQTLEPYVDHANDCLSRTSNHFRNESCNCDVDEVVASVDDAVQTLTT